MSTTADPAMVLPERPADLVGRPVAAWEEATSIPSYLPAAPDRYPAYLDQRVYQGSSGRLYPLPLTEDISATRQPVSWQAVHLENDWLRLMILPELGGRIHVALDRSTGQDFVYRNEVIKPALVGLAGPWIAGGMEFNWPQHHRPATFLPTDIAIEWDDDGAATVWCSDHDPFTRMKGMHGIRIRPDSAVVEVRVRLYNRDAEPHTFLWWANAAVRAHEDYQSFFPPDVTVVADHAKRAITGFPAADRPYYGIDYPARATTATTSRTGRAVAGDRIDWYRNIPVPTSYMCLHTRGEFFGGYDHATGVGIVHVADRQIAVGKKQWTWGQAPFGRAWDRNLADDDAAYVELMAGVFTDNQPDFAFIAPGETKVFSQYWYPIQQIGPVRQATVEAALSCDLVDADDARQLWIGVVTPERRPGSLVEVRVAGRAVAQHRADLAPGRPLVWRLPMPAEELDDLEIAVSHHDRELVSWSEQQPAPADTEQAAVEPAAPEQIGSVEELFVVGQHLAQYRHATASPERYWQEALRRDPEHVPSCLALAGGHYRAGQYPQAEHLVRTALARLTRLNPNPADTTAYYYLGLILRRQQRSDEAYDAFGRASWTRSWRAPAGHQLAILDARAGRYAAAARRIADVLRCEPDHLQARNLGVIVDRHLGRKLQAEQALAATTALDRLDWWARDLSGAALDCDAQTCFDVAREYAQVGEWADALRVLDVALQAQDRAPAGAPSIRPLALYERATILQRLGRTEEADRTRALARVADPTHCFPHLLDDADLLTIEATDAADPHAAGLLAHWLYDRRRHRDAIAGWQRAVDGNPDDAVCWRNLGLALWRHDRDGAGARTCYDRAVAAAPEDARLWFERDQLAERTGVPPSERLAVVADALDLVRSRDDATIAVANLYLDLDRPRQAMALLAGRRFQPWEGGEGPALGVWERVKLALARPLLDTDPDAALRLVEEALQPPAELGEARHPLANPALLQLIRGDALARLGRHQEATDAWRTATGQVEDFVEMRVQPFSAVSFSCVLAHQRLRETAAADELITRIEAHCADLEAGPGGPEHFATSRPVTVVLPPDPEHQQRLLARLLRAQSAACRGDLDHAQRTVEVILDLDPNHHPTHDLARMLTEGTFADRGASDDHPGISTDRPWRR